MIVNKKEELLIEIIDSVVSSCAMKLGSNGEVSITKEEVLSHSKKENIVMTRALLAKMIAYMGFSKTTIAAVLGISKQAVGKLQQNANVYQQTSCAFQRAYDNALRHCDALKKAS